MHWMQGGLAKWKLSVRPSTTRFPVSLRWTSYGCYPCEIAIRLKKVCYKVSLCELKTVSDKAVRHKLISVRRLTVAKKDRATAPTWYSLVAPQP